MLEHPQYASLMEHMANMTSIPATGNRPEIARAPDGAADHPPHHTTRSDGWTPERIRTFLYKLAETGVVADAARAAGMSRQSAYALRRRAGGRGFDIGWRVALSCAQRAIDDAFRSRVLHGRVDPIIRDGKVWGERHRHDNRLTMAVLTRLDRIAELESLAEDGEYNSAHGASEQCGDGEWQPSKSSTSPDLGNEWQLSMSSTSPDSANERQPSKSSTSAESANEWRRSKSSTSMDSADEWQPSRSSTSMEAADEWRPSNSSTSMDLQHARRPSKSSTSLDFGLPPGPSPIAAPRRSPLAAAYPRAPDSPIFVPPHIWATAGTHL